MDIVPLAMQFVDMFSQSYEVAVDRIHRAFLDFIKSYPWPGNVRELENLMRRAVLFCRGGELTARDLPPSIVKPHAAIGRPVASGDETMLDERVAMTEQEAIERALRASNFKRAPAARALGISRVTLYNKMKKYGLLGLSTDVGSAVYKENPASS